MNTWILIVVLGGRAVAMQEFNSHDTCMEALKVVAELSKSSGGYYPQTMCVKK